MRSAPQKQPMPTIACSSPSGNGGRSGFPSTTWAAGTGISSSRPGSASSGEIIRAAFRNVNIRDEGYGRGPRCARQPAFRWARQDSNLGPTDYESAALTAELQALLGGH